MLSKGSVAVLPGLLLLIAWWRRGTLTSRDLWRSAPFWAAAVALTLVNIWFQADKLVEPIRRASAWERLLGAGAVIWFYLHKALLPINLTFVYPQWQIRADAFQWWLPLAAAVSTTAFLWSRRRHPVGRAAFAAWLFFCLALVPVMGFTDVYFMKYSLVADHYQYIAVLVVAACVAAALDRLKDRRLVVSAATVLVLLLAAGTWRQSHLYAGDEALYRGTLQANPSAWMAQNNLGAVLLDRGDNEEALQHVQEALRLKPEYAAAQSNLCHILVNLHRLDAAIAPCAVALRFNPADPLLHYSLGSALASLGRLDEARTEFGRALDLKNDFADAHYKLAGVLEARGQDEAAVEHYREVLRVTPDSVMAHTGLGNALMNLGRVDDAEAHFRSALTLKPEFAEAHSDLGDLLLAAGRLDEAIVEYTTSLKYDPRSVDAHNNLGVILVRRGQTDEAIRHFRAALSIQPDFADARANLAAVLARRTPAKR
jgi:tetratricopeptide (TPR) repeat protein